MPSITKLKIQRNKQRVNLYLDGKFAFGLSLDKVIKKGLAVGQNLTQQQIEKLFFSGQLEKLYHKTLNFLSYRPRSEKEVKDYLKKHLPQELRKKVEDKILTKLKKQKLIDDYKFSLWWIEQRLTFRPKGKRLLKSELFKKGISREIIDETLSTIDEQKLKNLAKEMLKKKIKRSKNISKLELKKKLFSYLARRGFDFDVIKNVIDETL